MFFCLHVAILLKYTSVAVQCFWRTGHNSPYTGSDKEQWRACLPVGRVMVMSPYSVILLTAGVVAKNMTSFFSLLSVLAAGVYYFLDKRKI
jgi:hypothetical protein